MALEQTKLETLLTQLGKVYRSFPEDDILLSDQLKYRDKVTLRTLAMRLAADDGLEGEELLATHFDLDAPEAVYLTDLAQEHIDFDQLDALQRTLQGNNYANPLIVLEDKLDSAQEIVADLQWEAADSESSNV